MLRRENLTQMNPSPETCHRDESFKITMKTIPDNHLFCETRYINNRTASYASQRMNFKHGQQLGDIYIHDTSTCKKVRRILEKRVAQDYWKSARTKSRFTNRGRFETRHFLANQFQNIYGLSYRELRECA